MRKAKKRSTCPCCNLKSNISMLDWAYFNRFIWICKFYSSNTGNVRLDDGIELSHLSEGVDVVTHLTSRFSCFCGSGCHHVIDKGLFSRRGLGERERVCQRVRMEGKRQRACIIYLQILQFVSNCEADGLWQPQTCTQTCPSSCTNMLLTSRLHLPEKTINLELGRWNFWSRIGGTMHTEQGVPAVAH